LIVVVFGDNCFIGRRKRAAQPIPEGWRGKAGRQCITDVDMQMSGSKASLFRGQ
jgi:hypothetical protein